MAQSCQASATTRIGGSARASAASTVRWVGSTTASSTATTATVSQTNAVGPAVAVGDLHRRPDGDGPERGEEGREPRVGSHPCGCSLRDRESSSTNRTFGVQSATTKI